MIVDKNFYGGKFDSVIFFAPTKIEGLDMDDDNWSKAIDFEFLNNAYKELDE